MTMKEKAVTELTVRELAAFCAKHRVEVRISRNGYLSTFVDGEFDVVRTVDSLQALVDEVEGRIAAGNTPTGYEALAAILQRAMDQASKGKGAARHATNGAPFDQQPMQRLCESYGVGFALGQAAKKTEESQILPPGADVAELLGAINYLAGAILFIERSRAQAANENTPQKACG